MLSSVAIISEFNPFHNGHLYLLNEAKQVTHADVSIAILSGNWVQRGEPAMFDKWVRAKAAIDSGVDLVIELPFFYAVQPSHIFAKGAVKLATAIRSNWLAFGVETPGMDYRRLVENQPKRSSSFKRFDQPYASLFQEYLYENTGVRVNQPNDILAFGYADANHQLGSPLDLVAIKRIGSAHNQESIATEGTVSSATSIRKAIEQGNQDSIENYLPVPSFTAISGEPRYSWDDFWPMLRYELIVSSPERLRLIYQMTEGIECRLKDAARQATSFPEFLGLVKTKRYTYTRIQRLCCYVLMHAQTDEMTGNPDFLRILGLSPAGRKYLNENKKLVELPILNKVTDETVEDYLRIDERAGALFEMNSGISQDFYRHPYIGK
ncbi:nucleotidyltransferase [Lentilactobacillus sp. Marseille-Q4993]|uniref:nucleotidyltransferase n=1 Tax=Lentilactobacillus sp. Marseille-Q4993 TaxID=3039492 RepID=UPI0024BC8DCF|nr:nucleotidyltransferase [Lentilactobacillus sp. Marseille-Q4993]